MNRFKVSEPHRDVVIEVTRIWQKDQTSTPLMHEHLYSVFCFAEDDWPAQAVGSPISPIGQSRPSLVGESGSCQHSGVVDCFGELRLDHRDKQSRPVSGLGLGKMRLGPWQP